MWKAAAVTIMIIVTVASWATANAQAIYGQRLQGQGGWLLPVASNLLASDERDHVGRGSINAWDLSASVGTPVFAAAPGTVSYVDCYGYENGRSSFHQGYGCAVDISHGDGIVSQYAHCKQDSMYVRKGQQVDQWTVLCQVGTTGVTGWPHVHFVIMRNGSPIRLDGIFDRSQMAYCKFCRADNNPNAGIQGVQATGQIQTQPQAQVISTPSTGQRLFMAVGVALLQTGDALYPALVVTIFLLLLALWLSPVAVRIVIVCAGVCVAVAVTVAMLFTPQQTVVAMPQQAQAQAMPGDIWQYALELTVASEGWKCTNDGAYTAGGITQGTYNAWRKSKGLPAADVCQSLTQQERAQIFYDRYWIPSGANQLPAAIALTYVDHAFNAGVGAAKQGLQACGTNATCYNNWREQQYRGMRTCFLYCKGWINRVNKFRKYEGIQ